MDDDNDGFNNVKRKKAQGKTGKSTFVVAGVEEPNYEIFISNVAPIMTDANDMSMTIAQCYDAHINDIMGDAEKLSVGDIKSQDMTPKEFINP